MFNIGDFVRIVDYDDKYMNNNIEAFVGEEGVVIEKENNNSYPYNVIFFNKEMQKKSINLGWRLWREGDLEKIS